MAIYYLNIKQISRRDGSRATSAAAYRSGTAITDERSGRTFNHSARQDVEHSEIVLPVAQGAEPAHWARDRTTLWNRAEAAESRSNARVAREYAMALPHEFNAVQRLAVAREFSAYIAERYQVAVDLSIHQPRPLGDPRNFHAHLLTTTREVTASGLGAKSAAEITNSLRAERGLPQPWQDFRQVRERWAQIANEQLRRIGSEARIDARSLAAQGIERRPTTHLGLAVTSMERRGVQTEVVRRVRAEQRQDEIALRAWQAAAPASLPPYLAARASRTSDPSGYLPHSIQATGQAGLASPAARQRAGAEQWLASRLRGAQQLPNSLEVVQIPGSLAGPHAQPRPPPGVGLTPEQLPLPKRQRDGYEL